MKTIMKTLFVAVSSLSLMLSVNAGEMTVNGSAKATYNIASGKQGEAGIGITNELNFTASGEMDNGYAWSYSMDLDPDESDGSALNDDSQMSLTLNEMGTVKVCVSECSNNKKYFWDQSAYTSVSDTGVSPSITYPADEMSYNTLQYHTPELPFSTKGTFAWGNAKNDASSGNYDAAAAGNSITAYSLTTSPVDGLSLAASYYKVNDYDDGLTTENQLEEGGAYGIIYAVGNFTAGYGKSYKAPESTDLTTTTVEYYENRGISLAFAVNDALSVSYTDETSESNAQHSPTVTYDVDLKSVQAAYSLGGATLSLARSNFDNVNYVNGDDQTETIIAMSFAF